MLKRLPIVPVDDALHTKAPRRTTVSVQKVRTMIEKELRDIRNRVIRLEEEVAGVVPIRSKPERKAA